MKKENAFGIDKNKLSDVQRTILKERQESDFRDDVRRALASEANKIADKSELGYDLSVRNDAARRIGSEKTKRGFASIFTGLGQKLISFKDRLIGRKPKISMFGVESKYKDKKPSIEKTLQDVEVNKFNIKKLNEMLYGDGNGIADYLSGNHQNYNSIQQQIKYLEEAGSNNPKVVMALNEQLPIEEKEDAEAKEMNLVQYQISTLNQKLARIERSMQAKLDNFTGVATKLMNRDFEAVDSQIIDYHRNKFIREVMPKIAGLGFQVNEDNEGRFVVAYDPDAIGDTNSVDLSEDLDVDETETSDNQENYRQTVLEYPADRVAELLDQNDDIDLLKRISADYFNLDLSKSDGEQDSELIRSKIEFSRDVWPRISKSLGLSVKADELGVYSIVPKNESIKQVEINPLAVLNNLDGLSSGIEKAKSSIDSGIPDASEIMDIVKKVEAVMNVDLTNAKPFGHYTNLKLKFMREIFPKLREVGVSARQLDPYGDGKTSSWQVSYNPDK